MIYRNFNDLQIPRLFLQEENGEVQCFTQSNSMVSWTSTTTSFTFMQCHNSFLSRTTFLQQHTLNFRTRTKKAKWKMLAERKGKENTARCTASSTSAWLVGYTCKYFFFCFHMWAPLASKILVLQNAKFYSSSSSHATPNNIRQVFGL